MVWRVALLLVSVLCLLGCQSRSYFPVPYSDRVGCFARHSDFLVWTQSSVGQY